MTTASQSTDGIVSTVVSTCRAPPVSVTSPRRAPTKRGTAPAASSSLASASSD